MNEVERQWNHVMVSIYETAKRDLGYNASRVIQMVSEQGGVNTGRQLAWSDGPPKGSRSCGSTAGSI